LSYLIELSSFSTKGGKKGGGAGGKGRKGGRNKGHCSALSSIPLSERRKKTQKRERRGGKRATILFSIK